jgi:hypothetical protein
VTWLCLQVSEKEFVAALHRVSKHLDDSKFARLVDDMLHTTHLASEGPHTQRHSAIDPLHCSTEPTYRGLVGFPQDTITRLAIKNFWKPICCPSYVLVLRPWWFKQRCVMKFRVGWWDRWCSG